MRDTDRKVLKSTLTPFLARRLVSIDLLFLFPPEILPSDSSLPYFFERMKWNASLLYFLSRHRLPHLCSTHASSFIHCSSFIPCLAESFITTGDHKKTSLSILFISISWTDAKRQTEANDMREEETKGASFTQLSLTQVFVSLSKLCLSFKEESKYLCKCFICGSCGL